MSQLGKLSLNCAVAMATEVNNVDSVALDRVQTGHEMTRTRPRGQKFTVGRKKHSKFEDSKRMELRGNVDKDQLTATQTLRSCKVL